MDPTNRKPPSLTRSALRGSGFRSHVDARLVKELKTSAMLKMAYQVEAGYPASAYLRGVYETLKWLTEQNAPSPDQLKGWGKDMDGTQPQAEDSGGTA